MKLVTELKELKQLNKLTNSEIQVVDYLLDYPQEIAKLSSRQLATLTHTSAATVVRVCQKVGMSGYGEFKLNTFKKLVKPQDTLIEKIQLPQMSPFILF